VLPPPTAVPDGLDTSSWLAGYRAALDWLYEGNSNSILDGTVSCRQCRVLVLEGNEDGHYAWHRKHQPPEDLNVAVR
jgi:hypothetical protein